MVRYSHDSGRERDGSPPQTAGRPTPIPMFGET
jgi:hypothetical protein